ncbi:MAG: trypsin-like peptidase domain-containing protein [Pseudanabaenaceae cyanobacterium SKYGB_i_bin29]|nr:trypsin-like peptidase domain-containing protein [Pseudanabaenaceae cyanobacterium SKYG29]MDW8420468.1 trypsin-like peptidase domain-containing protein [Pseudanabaenaceae cyanobacterium SKYGB_i_bin29]
MRKLLAIGLLTTTLSLGIPPHTFAFTNDEQITINVYKLAAPAVVTLRGGGSTGSGSFISADGLILTNEHVVGRASQVEVRTQDGRRFIGDVIATDRRNDLALVRVRSNERFPFLRLADSSGIQVGQRVFAIGAPFGLAGTLTTGILSRIAPNGDLQTDAAINPGNSGGPLLNSKGELIGINKAIVGNGQGIGFATSAIAARNFIHQTANRPTPPPESRGQRLGVTIDTQTFTIQEINPNSIASRVGLRPGDRILAINNQPLRDVQELLAVLDQNPKILVLTIARERRIGKILIEF